ncbi:hypothetical protein PUNSTDRAFT_126525 [Punctularia strigosozonata HHB-11173 SS5]|uniref:uncharacterized protein n=1 Tax=Punctularia strigosozonata (strain HHB-11173) TaxID=741275 RepID=UPI00044185F4|nr:uncharacterized protein PUNSTDRAFT_126525 [Punctularia strigosozonata HHB-11173 SS5]EIN08527.1 hypothetical protein PUNSTDRAFT_126525 [Punctularia strigosozonata HHB-11173 SS5]
MPTVLDLSLGAAEIGVAIGTFLLGITVMQAYQYFRKFSDPWPIQGTVALLVALDLTHTALLLHAVYHYTITFYGVPTEISKATPSLSTAVCLSGIMAFVVQMFFARRVWALTKNPFLAGIAYVLSTARFGFSLASTAEAFSLGNFAVFEVKFRWGAVATLAVGACADVFIAITLCWTLAKSKTGIASTDKMLDKIIMFVMSTGLLTSFGAVTELICFLTMNNLIWLAIFFILAKLFSISLLVSLNARRHLRRLDTTAHMMNSSSHNETHNSRFSRNPVQIQKNVTIISDTGDRQGKAMELGGLNLSRTADDSSDYINDYLKGDNKVGHVV